MMDPNGRHEIEKLIFNILNFQQPKISIQQAKDPQKTILQTSDVRNNICPKDLTKWINK